MSLAVFQAKGKVPGEKGVEREAGQPLNRRNARLEIAIRNILENDSAPPKETVAAEEAGPIPAL